ncbi:hypothetical protein PR003_g14169 [Phytophthora rubi]|uniref:Uncharacterized protein n=1 Tax=Phytophthora rubi TaxID=129364 RepID=A0A6A4F087_9STRA|nr:hypothetical protein PR003_g14169 [Phytophthora rubi]
MSISLNQRFRGRRSGPIPDYEDVSIFTALFLDACEGGDTHRFASASSRSMISMMARRCWSGVAELSSDVTTTSPDRRETVECLPLDGRQMGEGRVLQRHG